MPSDRDDVVTESPTGWVAKHVRRYVESEGKRGHRWNGVDTLLLTTRGRSTGTLRRTALIYGEDRGRYIVVASNGGSKAHPHWYQNLVADPQVFLQVGADRFEARASTATARSRPRLWLLMVSIWPEYDRYQTRTAREIPVVILERTS
ncbi:MAG: nitroreductase family deazaflavin-dependent oxidoreductase [Actinomycetota bacterium]